MASSGSAPPVIMSHATLIPCLPLGSRSCPLAAEMITGRPASDAAAGSDRSRTTIRGIAAATFGRARPAAAAAPAPRKSRRETVIIGLQRRGSDRRLNDTSAAPRRPSPHTARVTARRRRRRRVSAPRSPHSALSCPAMSATVRDRLRQTQFLEGLTDSAIHQLAKVVAPVMYEADSVLFHEGSPRDFMSILVSGAVAIEKGLNGKPVRLVTLGAGQALGEGLLLDELPHGTSARALQRTEAYQLTIAQVHELVKEQPALYAALVGRAARSISQRLAATDATLVGHKRTLGFTGSRTRKEHDLLGERDVPEDALYGVQTLRALENFPITGIALREFPALIEALASVKEAAATANAELGTPRPRDRRADQARGAGNSRRPPSRALRRRHDPGRRRHVDEHERQRGHRESRARAARQGARQLRGRASQHAREPQPVHQRRVSDGGEAGAAPRDRRAARRDAQARGRVPRQGRRVFGVREDGTHAAPGRGADDARPGVRRVRPHDPGRRGPTRRSAGVDPRDQHGRDGDRHGDHRAGAVRGDDLPRAVDGSRDSRSSPRPTSSKRRPTRARSCSCRACSSAAR